MGVFGPMHLAAFLAWNAAAAATDPRKKTTRTTRTAGTNTGGAAAAAGAAAGEAAGAAAGSRGGGGNRTNSNRGGGNGGGEGGGVIWDAVKTSIAKDFIPALVVDTFYWLPVQAVNFAVMPVSKQLFFMNAACALDVAFLSWLGNHSGALGVFWEELKEKKKRKMENAADTPS